MIKMQCFGKKTLALLNRFCRRCYTYIRNHADNGQLHLNSERSVSYMAEDFGKKVEKFGQDVWKKTTDAFGVIGKQSEIASKSHDLREVYAEIGRQFCEKHSSAAESEFPDLCANALQLMQEISDLEEQVLVARGRRKCANCGDSIPKTAAYCPHCGTEQPKEETPDPEDPPKADYWVCPNCGASLDIDDLYCSSCGTKRP